MASAGTFISRNSAGPNNRPMTVSGSAAAYRKKTAVRTRFCICVLFPAPAICDTKIEIPEPMPRKTHSKISNGWLLVATAASAAASQ